jgi:hypothetical protein
MIRRRRQKIKAASSRSEGKTSNEGTWIPPGQFPDFRQRTKICRIMPQTARNQEGEQHGNRIDPGRTPCPAQVQDIAA